MTGVFIRGAFGQRHTDWRRPCDATDTQGIKSCKEGSRDRSDVVTRQRMPGVAGSHQNLLEERHIA